jgi:hypothetical protein
MIAAGILMVMLPALDAVLNGLASLLQLAIYPAYACAFTLLYYDLRVRKEAFDIEYLGDQMGMWSQAE